MGKPEHHITTNCGYPKTAGNTLIRLTSSNPLIRELLFIPFFPFVPFGAVMTTIVNGKRAGIVVVCGWNVMSLIWRVGVSTCIIPSSKLTWPSLTRLESVAFVGQFSTCEDTQRCFFQCWQLGPQNLNIFPSSARQGNQYCTKTSRLRCSFELSYQLESVLKGGRVCKWSLNYNFQNINQRK